MCFFPDTEQKADNIEQVFETTDITCMVPAKVTRTSENSGVEHKQGILVCNMMYFKL